MKKQPFSIALLLGVLSLGVCSCSTSEPVEDLTVKLESTSDTDGDNGGDSDPDGERQVAEEFREIRREFHRLSNDKT